MIARSGDDDGGGTMWTMVAPGKGGAGRWCP